MKKSMTFPTLLMAISIAFYIPSILQLFKPDMYVGIYLMKVAGISIEQLRATSPEIAHIACLGFQGIGLGALGYHLLAWPLLFIPFRKGEKWAWYTLGFGQLILWSINLYIEVQNGSLPVIIYSVVTLVIIVFSLMTSYRSVDSRTNVVTSDYS